jgi:hypothetical protein
MGVIIGLEVSLLHAFDEGLHKVCYNRILLARRILPALLPFVVTWGEEIGTWDIA